MSARPLIGQETPPSDAAMPTAARRSAGGPARDVRRIASSLFCSSEMHHSVVSFAKNRTANYWRLTEDRIDVLVAAELLSGAARLADDLATPDDVVTRH